MPALALAVGPPPGQAAGAELWGTDGAVNAIARGPDNQLFIGGTFTMVGPSTGGGVPVSERTAAPVGPFSRVAGAVAAAVSDGDGGWFIGGRFTAVGGIARANLAHILADGSVAAWSPDPDNNVNALALCGRTLYVGGAFASIGGAARNFLAAVNTSTGTATTWNPDVAGGLLFTSVSAIAVRGLVVYVGGDFGRIGGADRSNMAAIDAATGLAAPWNPGADSRVYALALHGNTLYVGGQFTHLGGQPRSFLGAVDLNTGAVSAWNPTVSSVPNDRDLGPYVARLAVQGNSVYAAGHFTSVGGQLRGGIAEVDVATGLPTAWNPSPLPVQVSAAPYVDAVLVHGQTVYLGGRFRHLGDYDRRFLAAVDARSGSVTPWDPMPGGDVHCLAGDGSVIYVGGEFAILGGVHRHGLAALDLGSGEATAWNPNPDGFFVSALAVYSRTVYVGGYFSQVGGQARSGIAALDGQTGAATSWRADASGPVYALALGGSTLYAGGWFGVIGGQPRPYLAALDTITGSATAWNPGANDIVECLTVSAGTVYAGGWFSQIGGQARSYIAALDTAAGTATAWDPSADFIIHDIDVREGVVFAAGNFNYIGGQARDGIAALDVATGQAAQWIANASRQVYAVTATPAAVYAGGGFGFIGGEPRQSIASLDPVSGAVFPWNPGSDGVVSAIVADAGWLYVGGSFRSFGGMPAGGLTATPVAYSPPTRPATALTVAVSPNPIQLFGRLRFCLPTAAPVSLAVYDLQGRRVAALLQRELKTAGDHEIAISTAGWMPGCYLYRLEANGVAATRKMLVVK